MKVWFCLQKFQATFQGAILNITFSHEGRRYNTLLRWSWLNDQTDSWRILHSVWGSVLEPGQPRCLMVPPEIALWGFGHLDFNGFGQSTWKTSKRICQRYKGQDLEDVSHTIISLFSNCAFKARVEKSATQGVVNWGFGDYFRTIENLVLSSQHHSSRKWQRKWSLTVMVLLAFLCDPLDQLSWYLTQALGGIL